MFQSVSMFLQSIATMSIPKVNFLQLALLSVVNSRLGRVCLLRIVPNMALYPARKTVCEVVLLFLYSPKLIVTLYQYT